MYDQYLTVNTFLTGPTGLPRHKGFLFCNSDTNIKGATFHFLNDEGNTFVMGLSFASGINILPMRVYSVLGMATGLTGLRLN